MKLKAFNFLLFLTSMLFGSFLSAQPILPCPTPEPGCAGTPKNVSRNLITQANYVIDIQKISYAKATLPSTFGDVKYAADGPFSPPTCPGTTTDVCLTDASNLYYNMYFPTPASYTNYNTCALPVIILFHSGGFVECAQPTMPGIDTICRELAKRGYIAMSVQYRAGRIKDPTIKYTSVQQQLAIYRACQDGRGAIRSIIKAQTNNRYFQQFGIQLDINNIMIGGLSAGGVVAMNTAWYTPLMEYEIFKAEPTSPTIQQALGNIDIDYYYGEPTIEYQSKIKATANMWGGIEIPTTYNLHEYDFFDSTLLKPHIGFHGANDPTFPFYDNSNAQRIFFSPLRSPPSLYNSETLCINSTRYTLDPIDNNIPDLISGSSQNMHFILDHFSIPNELYVDCDMTHGLVDKVLGFLGDFGTNTTNEDQASVYIAQRIAVFFQAVLGGIQGNLGADEFYNCENFRKKCEQAVPVNPNCVISCN